MAVQTISELGWCPDLRKAISNGDVRSFRTQKDARAAAKEFGWGSKVLKVERAFEAVHIVGHLDQLYPEMVGDLKFQALRIPMLRYEIGEDQVQRQPVLRLRRPWPA
jgi:hypothetical protein